MSTDPQHERLLDRLHKRRYVLAGGGLISALIGPVLWSILTTTDVSTGDVALIEMNVCDAWSGHPRLAGAYSRFGWAHPGPLMFHAFALPYRLFGGDTDALRL